MSLEVKVEQRTFIKFCVELGTTPVETKNCWKKTQSGNGVSRAVVYRWHKHFSEDSTPPYITKGAGRPTRGPRGPESLT